MVLKGDTGKIPERTREYLADALLGADRLAKIANDMLDISRIQTGRMKIVLADINLVQLLQKIHKEFGSVAKKKRLKLILDLPEELPHVFTDSGRLFQIVDNLLGNALKFTPSGGSITIRAQKEEDDVVVSVADTGIGIRPEDQKKLFKQFPQIDTGLMQEKGAGLGLALVWQLVTKMGGDIWVDSKGLGKGTTFSFRLPISSEEDIQKPKDS